MALGMDMDFDFDEVFQSAFDEHGYNQALSFINDGKFSDFKRQLKESMFNVDIYDNALLHHACKSGQFQFVEELLTYPTVVLTLSRMPEIMSDDSLRPEIFSLMIDSLQKDYVHNHNPQFINWLLFNEKHEFALQFQEEADIKYRRSQQLAIEYKPDFADVEMHDEFEKEEDIAEPYAPSFKRKREDVSIHYSVSPQPEKKMRHHEPDNSQNESNRRYF